MTRGLDGIIMVKNTMENNTTPKHMDNKAFYIAIFDRLLLCYLLIVVILYPEAVNEWLKIMFNF